MGCIKRRIIYESQKFEEIKTWQLGYVPAVVYFLVFKIFWYFERVVGWDLKKN
jgi:hypothetical protein